MIISLILALAGLLLNNTASAISLRVSPVAGGFNTPVGVVGGPNGRLFVLEKAGVIRIIEANGSVRAAPFLNISNRVDSSSNEEGLLGLAFHPNYVQNGLFYLNYTNTTNNVRRSRISRFNVTADPNRADPASEEILLTINQPFANHNAGHILFGADGYLYIPMGDGGSGGDPGNRAQNLGTLLGKVIRIDVDSGPGRPPDCRGVGTGDYTVPSQNPSIDGAGGTCDEIWALGLRNPWRSSVDTLTGELFMADVGQSAWEEIDHQPAASAGGRNYGWRCYEGNNPFDTVGCAPRNNYAFPIFEYNHSEGCTVIGGYVYRGSRFPAMYGRYLLVDFCSGIFWDLVRDGGGNWVSTRHNNLQISGFVGFGEASDGELYLVNINNGTVYHLREESVGQVRLGETTVNHGGASISLGFSSTPTVIVGPPTFRGNQPGVVRLNRVDPAGFDLYFAEWAYLDGIHANETVSFLVAEGQGRTTMPDGSIWEVGRFTLGGTGSWLRHNFGATFPGVPAIFLTAQSANGNQPVMVRARNVNRSGFEAALFEEEALMDGHANETVGYLAIYNPQGWGSIQQASGQVPYLLQRVVLNHEWSPVVHSTLRLQEEQSLDSELGHTDESVDVLIVGRQLFAQVITDNGGDTIALRRQAAEANVRMEWGLVSGVNHQWKQIPLAKSYTDPVVVAKPVSTQGGEAGVIRLTGVTRDRFQMKFQEWDYLDGVHTPEQVFYLVTETGVRGLNGLTVEAGKKDTNALSRAGVWEPVSFASAFSQTPALFSAVQSNNGSDAVITRIRSTSPTGFDLAMDEQESKNDGHARETLGWIAISPGSATTSDNRRVQIFRRNIGDVAATIGYPIPTARRYPVVVSDVMSRNGGDPVFIRYRNPAAASIDLFLQEEQSADTELRHALENISVFVAE